MHIEWVDVATASKLNQYEIGDYINPSPDIVYPNPVITEVKETCDSTDVVIQVDSPHRGIGGAEDCYIISIRPDPKFQIEHTYQTMLDLVNTPV